MKHKLLLFLILSGTASSAFSSVQDALCQLQNYTHLFTPRIIWAAQHCSSIDVLTELQHGAHPDRENWCKETALHWAAFYSQSVIIKHLIEYNAAPNHRDASGKTPLHWAFLPESSKPAAHNKVVSKLLNNGADPNIQDNAGKTPLHYGVIWPVTLGPLAKDHAYDQPTESALALLLDHGADPNIQDEHGDTPLHIVLREADTMAFAQPIISLFIQYGADPSIRNNTGEPPWETALKRSSIEEVNKLLGTP